MPRHPISVTLDAGNATWLKGRAGALGTSVSQVLDQIVTAARRGGRIGAVRSVVGTVDVDSTDPWLENADVRVREVFEASLGRPFVAHEKRVKYTRPGKNASKPRG
jgi:hypothetical protein